MDFAFRDSWRFARGRLKQPHGSGPSCHADTFPEGRYLFLGGNAALQRRLERCLFVVAEDIRAGSPRFDFARDFDEFGLVFFRPGFNAVEDVSCVLIHGISIGHLCRPCHGGTADREARKWWMS